MTDRRPLSKRTRFNVFKRDLFTCQYCGRTPPEVVLHCDHVIPVVEGGGDEEENLVTACQDCNLGKSGIPLDVASVALADRAERIAEAEEQLAAYRDLMRAVEARKEADVWEVVDALFGESETTQWRYRSIETLLERLPLDRAKEAARIAWRAQPNSKPTRFKYFCGVCWRMIREAE